MKINAHRLLAYLTGTLALVLVASAAVSALTYAMLHRSETLQNLATSTLSGLGIAIGGAIGGAVILRFQAARTFVKNVVGDIGGKHG